MGFSQASVAIPQDGMLYVWRIVRILEQSPHFPAHGAVQSCNLLHTDNGRNMGHHAMQI